MVEVFKTNVKERMHANMLIEQIHKVFMGYKANFDLDDCDRILRVKSMMGPVESYRLIRLLEELGFKAEILPDTVVR
ncbi:hypothetical protein Q4E93_00920 [Flavitalea sp. BT771]|uniref:hypothetical protein n=1 Tax=Flavitalea sp. BT771 TaxID=3063329 RepID=UPI0026E35A02|nr:hypothetical protein [Flavitalea sp. BT771]MDO6429127.1 hypothetical protein [Flavitalea sp. BT771]MDV6218745.1 hypothetical protein [Flavitalea sp. BT771]